MSSKKDDALIRLVSALVERVHYDTEIAFGGQKKRICVPLTLGLNNFIVIKGEAKRDHDVAIRSAAEALIKAAPNLKWTL
jgi:hypothetical protein